MMNQSKKKFNKLRHYFNKDNSWKSEVDEFVDIITNNKKVEIGNIADALDVMKMIYRIYNNDNKVTK